MDIDLDPAAGGGVTQTPGDFPRARNGVPYVTDPDGVVVRTGPRAGQPKLVAYRRMSGLGGDLDDRSNLHRHDIRQILLGVTVDDEPVAHMLVAYSETGDVGIADRAAARARTLAGSHLAADRGTHIHRIAEWVDLGRDHTELHDQGAALGLDPATQDAIAAVWVDLALAYGLETIAVETPVVHDPWRAAGTLDRIVRLDHDLTFTDGPVIPSGSHCVLDIKSGQLANGVPGPWWNAHTLQLAGYAGARPYDVDSGERSDWPFPIEQRWALIAHVPTGEALAGNAQASLIAVDIAAGRAAVEQLVLPLGEWRRRRGLFAVGPKVSLPALAPGPGLDDDDEFGLNTAAGPVAAPGPGPVAAAGDDDEFGLNTAAGPVAAPGPGPVAAAGDDDEFGLGPAQPAPKPARGVRHDFGLIPGPGADTAPGPGHDPTIEGSFITYRERDALIARVANLDSQARAVLDAIAREARDCGRPISFAAGATERRQAIYRALCVVAEEFGGDLTVDHIRALVAVVNPAAAQLDSDIGAALAAVDVDQAHTLAGTARRICAQQPTLLYADDRVVWRL